MTLVTQPTVTDEQIEEAIARALADENRPGSEPVPWHEESARKIRIAVASLIAAAERERCAQIVMARQDIDVDLQLEIAAEIRSGGEP